MKNILFILAFMLCNSLLAQYNLSLNVVEAINSETRSLDGKPGKNYWQNHGTYDINVSFDPQKSKVSGSETITYYNNSPDSLKHIILSVLSDAYRKQSARDYNWDIANFNEGVILNKVIINGFELTEEHIKRSGTNRILALKSAMAPNTSINLEIDWSFEFPDIQIRCGNYSDSTFFVAYFYPRIAVYDDIDGWDRNSYTMMTEFYSDFNDYNVNITVPKDFVVWATGELQNAEKVFIEPIVAKINKAKIAINPVHIITKEDIDNGKVTVQNEKLIYNFKATNVPDFAFAMSDKFLWDACSTTVDNTTGRSAFVSAAYRQDSEDYTKIAALTAKILKNYSTHIPGVPYPYPAMTVFNGNAGMEFPMMCNDASQSKWLYSSGLAYHEIAHTYFPFYMGTNERKYAWMDEGWASFLPMFYILEEDSSKTFDYISNRANRYYNFAGSEGELPIMTLSKDIKTRAPYRYTSYNKSFFAYYYLYRLLGEEKFKSCLKTYMSRWNGKHPIPYDFFHSFNDKSEMDLSWYWESWFFARNFADLSLERAGNRTIIVHNKGGLAVPIKITINYKGGGIEIIEHEADIWNTSENKAPFKVDAGQAEEIESIYLGGKHILDVNTNDNMWPIAN